MGGRRAGSLGMSGGGQRIVDPAAVINLSAFTEREVLIWSPDSELLFTFSSKGGQAQALLGSVDKNPNLTNLVPEWAPRYTGVVRYLCAKYPYLVVAPLTPPALVRYKPLSEWAPR